LLIFGAPFCLKAVKWCPWCPDLWCPA
jgi:hypothetical protein